MSTPTLVDTQTDTKSESTQPSPEDKLLQAQNSQKETQAAYTKGQQTISELKAENDKLKETLQSSTVTFTTEEQEKLDTLKFEDPDAWRKTINQLEAQHRTTANEELAKLTSEAKDAAGVQHELSRRQQVLKVFNDSATTAITDELIANDVPPRITNKLANGKISFEDFLIEVAQYVSKDKVVSNPDTLDQPNMGKMVGGKSPTDEKPAKSLSGSYASDMY